MKKKAPSKQEGRKSYNPAVPRLQAEKGNKNHLTPFRGLHYSFTNYLIFFSWGSGLGGSHA
jgi:hypothetical protein